jgi:hypothetical protein
MAPLNKDSWSCTALIVLIKKVKNCKLLIGVLLGLNKLIPVSVAKDQLLCFPEPFTPLNGFHEIILSNRDVPPLFPLHPSTNNCDR